MKKIIFILLLANCTPKEQSINIAPFVLSKDSLCILRGHVWNNMLIGESKPGFNQRIIDYKDSSVLFNERIRFQWFDCSRCMKKIDCNDTVIEYRERIFPPTIFNPDTNKHSYILRNSYIYKPNPPIKR